MKAVMVLIGILISLSSFAQDTLQLYVSPEKIKIGEPAELKLRLHYKTDEGKKEITWPEWNDTIIKNVEILETGKINKKPDKASGPNGLIQEQKITVTSFDSGYYAIPPLSVIINDDTLYSNPVLLEVKTVAVDTTKDIRGIKGIYETKLTWDDFWFSLKNWIAENWWWLAVIAAVIVAVILFAILKKRKKPAQIIPEKVVLPHESALELLAALDAKKLWQQGFIKEYYIELTDILRDYIEARFRIRAKEQTTDEIMSQLRLTDISEISKITLLPVLKLSDLVKFAKENPTGNENEEMMQRSRDFVISTIPAKTLNNVQNGV